MLNFTIEDLRYFLIFGFFLIMTACTQVSESDGSTSKDNLVESVSSQAENKTLKQDAKALPPKVKADRNYEAIAKKLGNIKTPNSPPRPSNSKGGQFDIGKTAVLKKEWGDFEHPVCGALKSAVANFPKDEYFFDHKGVRIDLLASIIKSEAKTTNSNLSVVDWKDVPEAERDSLYFAFRYAQTGKIDVDVRPNRYNFFDEPKIWADLERGYLNLEEYLAPDFRKTSQLAASLERGKIRVQRHDLGNNHVLFNAIDVSGIPVSHRDSVGDRVKTYRNSTTHIFPILALERETTSGPRYEKLANLSSNLGTSSSRLSFLAFTYGGKVQILSRGFGNGTFLGVVEYDPASFSSLEQFIGKHEKPQEHRRLRYAGTPEQLCQITLNIKKEWLPPKPDPVPFIPKKRAYLAEVPCVSPDYCYSKLDERLQDCKTGDSCDRAAALRKKYRNTGKPNSFTNTIGLSEIQPPEVKGDISEDYIARGDISQSRYVQRLDRTVDPRYIKLKRQGRSPNSEMCKRLETRLSSNLINLIKVGQWEVPSYDDPWTYYKQDFDLRWVTWFDSPKLKTILHDVFPYDLVKWIDVPPERAAQWEYDILYPKRRMSSLYSRKEYESPIEKPISDRPELGAATTRVYGYFRYIDIPVGEDAKIGDNRPTYRLFKYKYLGEALESISPHMPYPETPEYDNLATAYAVMYGRDQLMSPSLPRTPLLEFKKDDRVFFVGPSDVMREPNTLSSLSIKYFDPRKNPKHQTKIPHRWTSLGPVLESSYCRIDLNFSAE